MTLYDVYPLYDITPVSAHGARIVDDKGIEYLDFYGGHAVISIGHTHPHFIRRLEDQLRRIPFYSNAVKNPQQVELAELLGRVSSCDDYQLFLCNSGAEANENALKVASFDTGRSRVIAFDLGFHGRTSAAVAVTDNDAIKAPINQSHNVTMLPFDDHDAFDRAISDGDVCAVILECVQGIGGLDSPSQDFVSHIADQCHRYGTKLIVDEVQSGYGRTGAFFAFQHYGIVPDIITMAKGMGNGFPVGGVLISDDITPTYGQLGSTFGGNHLACAAALAVLEIIDQEDLISHAKIMGDYLDDHAHQVPQISKIKGRGLMKGLTFDTPIATMRERLIYEQHLFTGSSKNPRQLRILPPLTITTEDIDSFFDKLKSIL